MTNPLVHPGDNSIKESDEFQRVDANIDNEIDGGLIVAYEQRHGADFYVALEQIAAEKTGHEPADVDPDLTVGDWESIRKFCENIGVSSEFGGHALYRLVSDAVDHHDGYDQGHKLQTIARHYSTNKKTPIGDQL